MRAAAERPWLTEVEAKEVLAAYGIPVVPTTVWVSPEEAARRRRVGRPVALKVLSPDIPHKTDVGGVMLGLADPETVHRRPGHARERAGGAARGPHRGPDGAADGDTRSAIELIVGIAEERCSAR